jgi:hypothetical protein
MNKLNKWAHVTSISETYIFLHFCPVKFLDYLALLGITGFISVYGLMALVGSFAASI